MISPETFCNVCESVVSSLHATRCKAICPPKKVYSVQILTGTEFISVGSMSGEIWEAPPPFAYKRLSSESV